MEEEEVQTNSMQTEVATPETIPHEEQSKEIVSVSQSSEDNRKERNWKAFREKQRELEKELRMQREINDRLLKMTDRPAVQEVDELDQISDDEYIQKGKVKKLVHKEKDKIVKQTVEEVEKLLKQRDQANFMDRLKRQYSDFDEIVNADTIALLEINDPELAETIADLKDPYKIGIQSYKYIKALGLSEKAPEARRSKEVEKKLEQNAKTVQTPQAYDKRPMAQAFKMTDAEKTKIYEEMMGYASQAGFSY